MGFTLDRSRRRSDLAFDVRVIDRFSSGAALLDLRDEPDQLFQREHKLLVSFRHFDHDASHGASSVESPRQALDGMALPQLSRLRGCIRPRSGSPRAAQDQIHTLINSTLVLSTLLFFAACEKAPTKQPRL